MSHQLQVSPTLTASLLADRKLLKATDARFYLAARMRVRTPGGAAEYLKVKTTHEPEAWDARVKVSLDVTELYREMFPIPYAASQAPHFSTRREHEFYRLVNQHLFPLCVSDDGRHTELDAEIERDPSFFLPCIPVTGTQQHNWLKGCCPFPKLQTVFQLALYLSRHHLARGRDTVGGVALGPEPPRPLSSYGWTHFRLMCGAHDTPIRFLPMAFHMVSYKTGSVWLDIPPVYGAGVGLEWDRQTMGKLFLARRKAEEINAAVLALNRWLVEDPEVRVRHAVELWNAMGAAEEAAGFDGLGADDMNFEEVD